MAWGIAFRAMLLHIIADGPVHVNCIGNFHGGEALPCSVRKRRGPDGAEGLRDGNVCARGPLGKVRTVDGGGVKDNDMGFVEGIEASTAPKMPAQTSEAAIEVLWSTQSTTLRKAERPWPNTMRCSGMTVLYSGW